MIDKDKTEIIIAGPGVGKTTTLLNRIEDALAEGVPPVEIAFFSFSTTAVNEGLSRIVKRLKYKKSQFRYFKTLHAMAFHLLGLHASQVISNPILLQFAKDNDLKLASKDYRTGIVKFQTQDSVLLSQIDSAKLLGMSIRDFFIKNHIDNVPIARAEELAAKYDAFKVANGIVDFTDMILFANKMEFDTPYFQYMFIDEAQDLSTQQWRFVEKMAENTDHVVVVGDERQAIAEFAGADVDCFLNLEGQITLLDKSYRVPKVIHKLARKVEKYMTKTRGTMWYPRTLDFGETVAGEVIRITELPIQEMVYGTWLILVRTNAQLTEFKDYMMQYCNKVPMFFTVDGQAPVDLDIFKAIMIFEIVSLSDKVTKYDFIMPDDKDSPAKKKKKIQNIMLMKKFMSSKEPKTAELDSVFMHRFNYKNWFDAFDKVPIPERRYVNRVRKAYTKKPDGFTNANIKLSTIHSAKGMEADNVVLYTVLTSKVYNEWKDHKDAADTEAKVLFVAVTRARKRLFLLGRTGAKYSYKEMLD